MLFSQEGVVSKVVLLEVPLQIMVWVLTLGHSQLGRMITGGRCSALALPLLDEVGWF